MGQFICIAIKSVLDQKTVFSYELIIVDDGSTDAAQKVLEPYKSRNNVTVIRQENQGAAEARNRGISAARGNYLMFLDVDDRLLSGAIQKLMNVALQNDADVVEGAFMNRLPDGTVVPGRPLENKKVPPMELQGFFCGKVYKRKCFESLVIPKNYWFEDSLNHQILWSICKNTYTIADFVYEYMQNMNGSTATSLMNPKAIDSFYITRQLLKDRKEAGFVFAQRDYQYFLEMAGLTYRRTRFLKEEVRRAIFVLQCELIDTYYKNYEIDETKFCKKMEIALKNRNYRNYLWINELYLL